MITYFIIGLFFAVISEALITDSARKSMIYTYTPSLASILIKTVAWPVVAYGIIKYIWTGRV